MASLSPVTRRNAAITVAAVLFLGAGAYNITQVFYNSNEFGLFTSSSTSFWLVAVGETSSLVLGILSLFVAYWLWKLLERGVWFGAGLKLLPIYIDTIRGIEGNFGNQVLAGVLLVVHFLTLLALIVGWKAFANRQTTAGSLSTR